MNLSDCYHLNFAAALFKKIENHLGEPLDQQRELTGKRKFIVSFGDWEKNPRL